MRSNLLLLGLGAITLIGAGSATSNTAPALATTPADAVVLPVAAVPAPVKAAADDDKDKGSAAVSSAVASLSPHVTRLSNDEALQMAITAYYNYKAANPQDVRKPYLYFVDYGLNNTTARGYVFNMETLTLVEGPFVVAHGRGSSAGKNGRPTRFSNRHGSAATSLGLYVAQETYGFSGKSGGQHYTSIGLRMKGVSGNFNSNARARGVVVHGAPYVTSSGSGRSEGCPAMEQSRARRLIPQIAEGGLVFLYSPVDQTWRDQDPWVNAN